MKQKGVKFLIALIAIILIAGTIIIFTKGLAFELEYQDAEQIELYVGKEINETDIKQITDEVFEGEKVIIRIVEVYKDSVNITVKTISEEQKDNLVQKINEKYETELLSDDVTIEQISHIRGRDIIKPYIKPFIIATVIVLVYIAIRYYKLNSFKVLLQSIGIIAIAQLILLGIMAITRMPVGKFTVPAILLVYMLSIYICTFKFDNDLEIKKTEVNGK